jgi:hypothetical protein
MGSERIRKNHQAQGRRPKRHDAARLRIEVGRAPDVLELVRLMSAWPLLSLSVVIIGRALYLIRARPHPTTHHHHSPDCKH